MRMEDGAINNCVRFTTIQSIGGSFDNQSIIIHQVIALIALSTRIGMRIEFGAILGIPHNTQSFVVQIEFGKAHVTSVTIVVLDLAVHHSRLDTFPDGVVEEETILTYEAFVLHRVERFTIKSSVSDAMTTIQ